MARFVLADARAILARTPDTLGTLLRGLPANFVQQPARESTWRPLDVLGHLIHGDLDDWVPRARVILERGDTEAFAAFDRSGTERTTAGKSLEELLEQFAETRTSCLRSLDSFGITDDLLDKRGRHPDFGSVTLRQLLATWTVHDLSHIGQIADGLARHYGDEVGPWRRFLPVLDRPEEDSG